MVQTRQTAYKVWIADVLKGEYYKEEGEWDPNYVLIKDKRVSRVNIIATVTDKFTDEDGARGYIVIDDASGSINAKVWKDDVHIIQNVGVGNLVLIIGRVKQFNNETYVTPEVVKVLSDASWAKVRRLELDEEYGKPPERHLGKAIEESEDGTLGNQEKVDSDIGETSQIVSESIRQKILNLIGKEEEASYDNVVTESGIGLDEVKNVIDELLKEGEIYQSRPGFLKIIQPNI